MSGPHTQGSVLSASQPETQVQGVKRPPMSEREREINKGGIVMSSRRGAARQRVKDTRRGKRAEMNI